MSHKQESHRSHTPARTALSALSGLLMLTAACAKAPPVAPPAASPSPSMTIAAGRDAAVKASMTLAASQDVNPDANGRPSPVVVRVFQLRTDAAFGAADFFALEDEAKALGAELITRDEYVLTPAETRTIDIAVAGDARFVGVVASYRDIRNAQWRAVAAPPRKVMKVAVERSRVVLTVE